MKVIDLRSDTVTLPTPAMREAMYRAEVGDDVFGEDPTVNRLEAMAAERMGKEAALFVVSGTMANLVSLLTHCGRGHEIIVGDLAHTFLYEQGGSAALGGIHVHTLRNQPDGTLDLREIEGAIRADNIHFPRTRLSTPTPWVIWRDAMGWRFTWTGHAFSMRPWPWGWTRGS